MYRLDFMAGKGKVYDNLRAEYADLKNEVELYVRKAQGRSPAFECGCQFGSTLKAQEMLHFVRDAEVMAIEFFIAPAYEDLTTGLAIPVLHAFVLWNGNVRVHVSRDVRDTGVGEAARMFLNSDLNGEADGDRDQRRLRES
jgi:hypothetical protein